VGQYFTLYDGVSKEQYQRVVAAAPFDKCNLLILAFVRTFTFHRPPKKGGPIYVAQFANGRDPFSFPLDPNDTDGDRVKLVVETARKKNPSINILISLGWGANDAGKAALTPVAFADSVRALVQAYDLNGFDVDFESTTVKPAALLALTQEVRRSLNKIPSRRPMIMTITPARDDRGVLPKKVLTKNVLEQFSYIMPQTYDHGGNGTDFVDATWLAQQLGSYSRIVYGLNSEGYSGKSDDPKKFAHEAQANGAAGIFAWRLNGDSVTQRRFPTFATAVEMWNLLYQRA
jgi:GH18 family chitinase